MAFVNPIVQLLAKCGPAARERLLLAVVAATGAWLALAVPVFAQESYYWAYARHPALSYFDHPPMVAWLIWLGTQPFGDGAVGIRLGTWLCGGGVAVAGLLLLRQFGVDAAGRKGWLVLCLGVPGLVVTRFLANPDPPLVLFWTLCMYALWRARGGGLRWWLLAGVTAGLSLLSKYTAIFLAPGGVLLLLLDPPMRRQLLRPGPWVGVLCAALTFLPVIAWNVGNDFASFRFQTGGRWQVARLGIHSAIEWLSSQLLFLHPAVCALLLPALVWLLRRIRDPRVLWCLAFGLPLPLYLLVSSFWINVKINWLTPALVPLLLGSVLWWREAGWLATHSRLQRIAAATLLAVPLLTLFAPLTRLLPQRGGSSWNGWEEIAARVRFWEEELEGPQGEAHQLFFFGANYRDAAQLMRHLSPGVFEGAAPGEVFRPTLAQNVFGEAALQFDYWEQPERFIGQDAIFVLPRPDDRRALPARVRPWFAEMRHVERVSVRRLGIHIVDADIFLCYGYRRP